MDKTTNPRPLRPYEAVVEFCDPALVQEICRLQTLMEDRDYRRFSVRRLPCAGCRPEGLPERAGDREYQRFLDLWRDVKEDFVRRVEDGDFHMTGVQIGPELHSDPVAIPSAWVCGGVLDLALETLVIDPRTYRQLRVVPGRSPARGTAGPAAPVPIEIAPKSVPTQAQANGGNNGRDAMEECEQPKRLKLREAVIEWCDPDILAAIRGEEGWGTLDSLARLQWPCLSGPDFPRHPKEGIDQIDYPRLDALWKFVTTDFVRRMEDGDFYLSGVQQAPELTTAERPIPGVWASACKFDFRSSVVTVNGMRFGSVTASRIAPAPMPSSGTQDSAAAGSRPTITAETAVSLSDEEVFALLEDYARRVVEEEGSSLGMPVKVSFMPIIRRRMEHRIRTGEACSTLAAEAEELAAWIKIKVSGHQTPKPGSIENELREDYWRLKPSSTAMIP